MAKRRRSFRNSMPKVPRNSPGYFKKLKSAQQAPRGGLINPERDGVRLVLGDPIHHTDANRCQCSLDSVFGKHVGERQVSVLKELALQESDLLPKSSLIYISHP